MPTEEEIRSLWMTAHEDEEYYPTWREKLLEIIKRAKEDTADSDT